MKNNKGISLIEIIVSILILALIVGPFTGIFIQSRMVRKTMSRQLKAIYAVRNEMEMLMSMNSGEVYGSKGEKSVDDIFIRTQVHPYDAEIGKVYCFSCKYLSDLIRNAKITNYWIFKDIIVTYMGFPAFYPYHLQGCIVNHPCRSIKRENLNWIGKMLK